MNASVGKQILVAGLKGNEEELCMYEVDDESAKRDRKDASGTPVSD
jgi:hypothetical protein